MTTNVGIYITTNVAGHDETNVRPKFSNVPLFPDNMEIPNVWIPPNFSDVPFFPHIMIFSNFRSSSVPPKFSYVVIFLENMEILYSV